MCDSHCSCKVSQLGFAFCTNAQCEMFLQAGELLNKIFGYCGREGVTQVKKEREKKNNAWHVYSIEQTFKRLCCRVHCQFSLVWVTSFSGYEVTQKQKIWHEQRLGAEHGQQVNLAYPLFFLHSLSPVLCVGWQGHPISDRDYFKVRRSESLRLLCVDSTVNTSLPFLAAAKALLLFF